MVVTEVWLIRPCPDKRMPHKPATSHTRWFAWEMISSAMTNPATTSQENVRRSTLSIKLPSHVRQRALIKVAAAYRLPKLAFVKLNSFRISGTNRETKKVCPKLEKKVSKKPNRTRLLFWLKKRIQERMNKGVSANT